MVPLSETNVDLIRSFEDKFVEGDIDYVLSILTDDVTVHECASVPYPGDHRGKEAFVKLAEAFGAMWDIQAPLDLEIRPAGNEKVLVLVGIDAIAKPTGKPIRIRIAEIYTIREGKIADIVVHYWDTHEMVEATRGAKILEGEGLSRGWIERAARRRARAGMAHPEREHSAGSG